MSLAVARLGRAMAMSASAALALSASLIHTNCFPCTAQLPPVALAPCLLLLLLTQSMPSG